jgi:DNA-directed RNA polymerase specialized sigma subunit
LKEEKWLRNIEKGLIKMQETYNMNEKEKIKVWQQTKDPSLLADLVMRYQPIVRSVVNKYKTTGVSRSALNAKASAQLMRALNNYDSNKGTVPSTHIWNNLQKVQRMAGESLMSGHIPEYRNIKKATFNTVKYNLEDTLGYEPNIKQMADELKWSQAEVQRMNKELSGEATASSAEFDFYGNSTQIANKDKDLFDYLYNEVDDRDKVILEHTFGYGGKPILKNKEIAKKLRTNEMYITRRKRKLSDKIRSYK